MHIEPKRISVHPDSELARLLDEAAAAPVLLEKDGSCIALQLRRQKTCGQDTIQRRLKKH
jgi:hypothetical protein